MNARVIDAHLHLTYLCVPCRRRRSQGVRGLPKADLGDAAHAAAGRSVQPERPAGAGVLLPQRVHRQQGYLGGAEHAGGDDEVVAAVVAGGGIVTVVQQ